MFDLLDDIKKNIDDKVPRFGMYLNIINILLLSTLSFFLCILILSYQKNEANPQVFKFVGTLGATIIVLFYIKNMSRINLFMRSNWVSLTNTQKTALFVAVFGIVINLLITYFRSRAIFNNFSKNTNILIILTGITLSITVARIIHSITTFNDYIKDKNRDQIYHQLNTKLNTSKLEEIKQTIEGGVKK